jgi:hypothetical protein
MDYKYVRELMMRWDLTPKKLPFEKFLYESFNISYLIFVYTSHRVVVLGTTSAGKSAFVNHFFGLQVKRSAVGHIWSYSLLPSSSFASFPSPRKAKEWRRRMEKGEGK